MPNKTNFNRALDRMVEKKAQEHRSTVLTSSKAVNASNQLSPQYMNSQAFYNSQARMFQPILDAMKSQNQGQ